MTIGRRRGLRVVAILVVLVALASGGWLVWNETTSAHPNPRDPAADEQFTQPPLDPTQPRAESAAPPRQDLDPSHDRAAAPAKLVVTVIGCEAPALAWRIAPSEPRYSDLLSPTAVPVPSEPLLHSAPAARPVEIDVPAGAWIRLRAFASRRTADQRFVDVPPFTGTRSIEINLARPDRSVHVHALAADQFTPARQATVRLVPRVGAATGNALDAMRITAVPAAAASTGILATTDQRGYARFDNVAPGIYVVVAPGASPEDPPPRTQLALLAAVGGSTEVTATVVAPPATGRVRLRVRGEALSTNAANSRLVLRPYGMRGNWHVMTFAVMDGVHEHVVDVAAGDYEVDVVPEGTLRFVSTRPRIRVENGAESSADVHSTGSSPSTTVTLTGPRSADFPMLVEARRAGAVQYAAPGLHGLSQRSWRTASAIVAPLEGDRWIVGEGRSTAWISTAPHRFDRDRVDVTLQRGTLVTLFVESHAPLAGEDVLVDIAAGEFHELVSMQRVLRNENGRYRSVLTAKVIVPPGAVRVTAVHTPTDVVLLEREFVANGAPIVVRSE